MRVGELLVPVVDAMRKDLLNADYLQADETTVPVQMHDGRGSNHEAYLWQYGKPGGETVFAFCLSRGREGPKKFLGSWEGILQTDGYQAYDGVGGPNMVHVGCGRMDALFLVDRDARQKAMSDAERLAHPGATVARRDSRNLPNAATTSTAAECAGQSGGQHAEHVAEVGAVCGIRDRVDGCTIFKGKAVLEIVQGGLADVGHIGEPDIDVIERIDEIGVADGAFARACLPPSRWLAHLPGS
jgi:Transposase IS66 family